MKQMKWLLLLLTVVGALISSCGLNTPGVSSTSVMITAESNVATAILTPLPESLPPTKLSTSASGISPVLLIDEQHKDGFRTNAAKITAVTLDNDVLKIQVVYQGGCQEHTFELHAETAFLQSYPSQGILYLSHDAHEDSCTENVEKLLSFDLAPLNKERNDPSERPLLLRIYEPAGGSFAKEPFMPLIEWP